MAKYRAMATTAFSPPERGSRDFMAFPGGWALMSMPQSSTCSGSSSSSLAWPPPKRSRKVSRKASSMSLNCRAKIPVISRVRSSMTPTSSPLAFSTSSRWPVR